MEAAEDRARALIARYEADLRQALEPRRAGRLHYECARLYEHPLRDLAQAASHYGKALAAQPEHVPTIRGARRVRLAQQQYREAVPLFDAEARLVADGVRKATLLRDKGLTLEHRVHNRKEALPALALAAQLDPTNPTWLKPLVLAQVREEAWAELGRSYEQAANGAADPRQRAALVTERARLFEAHHKNAELATELYRSALAHDARAPGAVHALKQLDYGQKRWHDLIAVLEHEVKQAADADVRALALYRIARIEIDRLGSLDNGVAALERALRETPDDTVVLSELGRLYELRANHEGLAAVLERLVRQAVTPADKVGLLHRIGQLHEDALDDDVTAIAWYTRALAINPSFAPVLRAVERLYTKREQWQPLIGTLVNAAAATQDPERRASHHAAVGDIYERRLGDAQQAIEHHAQALSVVPGYDASQKALSRLLESLGRFRELVELHERAVELAPDTETKTAHLFKIGLYLEDALQAPARALEAYKRILALDAHNLGAILAWQRAAERASEWAELVRALETEASQSPNKAHTASLLHRAGEILADRLEDDASALERYRKVLGLVPRHTVALASMARLFAGRGRWEDLLDTYRRELDVTAPGPAAAALRCKMAELCEEKLGRNDEALKLYREAVEAMPTLRTARRGLERKLTLAGKWTELVKTLEQALAATEDPIEKAHLGSRIAEIYENRLDDAGRALVAYDHALKAQPSFRPALDGRARLLAQAKSFARLADELGREAEAATDPTLAAAARYREAQIRRDELNDAEGATRALEAVLAIDPRHLGALLGLEALYSRLEQWDRLAADYVAQSQVLTDARARVSALHQLAQVQHLHSVADAQAQRQTYFAIVQLAPDDLTALDALEALAIGEGDVRLLAQVDAKLATLVAEAEVVAAHQTRLGDALEGADPVKALEVYRAALAQEPDNYAAAHGLARLAERSRDAALLEEAAEQLHRVTDDASAAAGLLVKAARSFIAQSDVPRAVKVLERALTIDPDHALAAAHLSGILEQTGEIAALVDTLTQAAQKARSRERRGDLWLAVATLLADREQDLPAAIAAARRVVTEDATHVPAQMMLADLYGRDAQWEPATAHLQDALKHSATPEVSIEARLKLAELFEERLRAYDRALQHVNAVLTEAPEHRAALHRLLSVNLRTGEHAAAAQAAERLMAVSTNPRSRAEAQVTLAQVERARGNPAAALTHLEGAVGVLGLEGRAASELKALLQEQRAHGHPPAWRGYVSALDRYLKIAPHDAEVLTPVYLEAARVLADELRQNEEALQVIDRGLALAPGRAALHAERALRLEHAGDLNAAATAWRRVLELEVTRPEAWRALVAVLGKMGRQADAAIATAPLVALGAATDLEQSQVAALPVRAAMAPAGSLTADEFQAIDPLGGTDAAEVMLSLLGEALPKLFPADLSRLGLAARDRITSRSGHPLRLLTDRVAGIFGLPDHQLFVQEVHAGAVEVELTDPVSVVVPAYLMNLSEAQQVFLIGRVIANAVRRLSAVDRFGPREVELILVAGAQALGQDVRTTLDAGSVSDLARRITKTITRRARRSLEDVVPTFAGAPPLDAESFVAAVRTGAARAALIVSDELPGSIALLRRLEGDLSGLQGETRLRGVRLAEDLLRFWASEPAFRLRRRMGLV